MTRSAAATVRRPGLSTAPATSTSTWFQFDAEKQPTNGHNHSTKIRGTVSTMIGIPPCLLNPPGQPRPTAEITMAVKDDDLRERITAFAFPRGGVEVARANRGYTLYSQRTGGPLTPDRPGRHGSSSVVATRGLGRSRRLRPHHHAAQSSPRVYRLRRLLLDPCVRSTTSRNVQSRAQVDIV